MQEAQLNLNFRLNIDFFEVYPKYCISYTKQLFMTYLKFKSIWTLFFNVLF